MREEMLHVPIDGRKKEQILATVRDFLRGEGAATIFTPNPEILVRSWLIPSFCDTLRTSNLNIPDGIGLVWLSKVLGKRVEERVTGTGLLDEVCKIAAETGRGVFFLGGEEGAGKRAAEKMLERHPGLIVSGVDTGGKVSFERDRRVVPEKELLTKIKKSQANVLFVALGQEKQEKWIESALPHLPSVRLAMGIGGAFDFWAGRVRRAPKTMRKLGLEWLWRLLLQPRRIGRIMVATVVFPALVLGHHFGIIKLHEHEKDQS